LKLRLWVFSSPKKHLPSLAPCGPLGLSLTTNQIKGLDKPQVDGLLPDADLSLAVKANWSVMCSADVQVELLEQRVTERVKLRAQFSFS